MTGGPRTPLGVTGDDEIADAVAWRIDRALAAAESGAS